MKWFPDPQSITATQFELAVKKWFEAVSHPNPLEAFEVKHLELMDGVDGEYEFDVTIRFTVLGGMKLLICCECKKHKNAIKREVVQVLHDKVRSVGAHKGCVVSTAPFQSGAQEYAKQHGIALIIVERGNLAYIQNSGGGGFPIIPDDVDDYAARFECETVDGIPLTVVVNSTHPYWLQEILRVPTSKDPEFSDSANED